MKSHIVSSEAVGSGWRYASAAIAFLLLLTVILYQQTFAYLTRLWNGFSVSEYAHGYLVLAISVYLIVVNRKQLAKIAPCPSYVMLPFVLAASFVWLIAVLVDVQTLQTVGLLLVVLLMVWAVSGHQAMRFLVFPILFISFAIPVWFPLSPLLQDLTADVVFWVIRILEVPALRQENVIVVPAGMLSIEEACSGLRYLLAALTLGSLYAYLNYVTLTARVAVVLVSAAAAVLANILRVFIIVYLGYATDMQHPLISDHLMLGWYLFGGLVAILLFADARLYQHKSIITDKAVVEVLSGEPSKKRSVHFFVITVLCAILLLTGPIIAYQIERQQHPLASQASIHLPAGVEGWTGPYNSKNDWEPKYQGSMSLKKDYQASTEEISLYIAYYPRQKQGEEVINDLNRISNTKIWRAKYTRPRIKSLVGHKVMEQLIENNQGIKRLVWYWYNISGWVTVNKYEAKGLQLAGMLAGNQKAYMVAASMIVDEDENHTRQQLSDFVFAMEKSLANIVVKENISEQNIK